MSRTRRKSHVRFLGGDGAVMCCCYPAERHRRDTGGTSNQARMLKDVANHACHEEKRRKGPDRRPGEKRAAMRVSRYFEDRLAEIEAYCVKQENNGAFRRVVLQLLVDEVAPLLVRSPETGRRLLDTRAASPEATHASLALQELTGSDALAGSEVREYAFGDESAGQYVWSTSMRATSCICFRSAGCMRRRPWTDRCGATRRTLHFTSYSSSVPHTARSGRSPD
ncbi:hypothetical protein BRCH_04232c [Candidatus Burkholderia brachyanthoides]|nr:hypothetical protein BRCH_04232c [Candidatus Burkholderia brachyanthoides]